MTTCSRTRLSAMMFLQYAVNGCFLPVFSHYLKNHLGFAPVQVGVIMAMPAVAALIAPFLMARVADRLISAERLLGLNHAVAAAVMIALYYQRDFWPVLVLYLIHGMVFVPTFALTNAVTFHHIADAQRDFGRIRMWGPFSWVVVAWSFAFLWLREGTAHGDPRLPYALVLSAVFSVVLALYAFTLPPSVVGAKSHTRTPMSAILRVFTHPNMVLLCVLALCNAMVHQCYYFGMGPFLSQSGFVDRHIMPIMSMGQFGEVFMMLGLGLCLTKLGMKRTLLVGIFFQVVRSVIFAWGWKPLVVLIIPTHGICYACFFAVAYIYVDQNSSRETRAGAQQIFNILIAGLGNLGGNLVAGRIAQAFLSPDTGAIDFRLFWMVSAAAALVLSVVLLVFFRERREN